MKDIQNNKTLGMIAVLAFILGIIALVTALCTDGDTSMVNKKTIIQMAGMLLALSVVLFLLMLQISRRKKNKRNHYHAVHWNDGHISKD